MGILAESWQTPYSETSPAHYAGTGRRVGAPHSIKNAHYHRVHCDVAHEKHEEGLARPGNGSEAKLPEKTENDSESRSRNCIAGVKRPLVFVFQRTGMCIHDQFIRIC